MEILRQNGIRKLTALFLLLMLSSCNSLDDDEYEVLNLAIDKCVFKCLDLNEVSEVEAQYKVSSSEAIAIIDRRTKDEQYTFTISDTLDAVDISKDNWDGLHNFYAFDEIKNRSDQAIPVDFSKIEEPKNIKRVAKAVNNKNYLGHYKFHRVLFDKSRKKSYVQIDPPKGSCVFGPIGLRLKKENGKWEFEK
ncbi:hypothetical protein EG347_08130 [Chryseobacterium sp. G0186]|uniref:hypothetical protein n=1 Tax=Chryseobacterium sp. G0186 TaxID=2487064 RepID=UPI000F513C8D|nr:hypothetical protein [Chryseobacterium sp. G0186]AZA77481.1 hypothetical protein EG347_08130 [Chryseobacterium sp. G0186]